ncbi:pyrimidine-specific ribonucleoside hydrolase RihA-like [Diabrotica undecimpunctata]|uniref:pyrimidine-specific ribonucleoside hydrolase RihA-like n=1 Tax=Diabrotica undecimpunctata TaxID=50387 RepID=UPI003B634FEC
MKMRRVILDVDVGTDDYMALLHLLHAQNRGEIKIEGIVCTSGNTDLDHVVVNTVRLLELIGRTDIPVFKGARRELILLDNIERYHGEDGLGDLYYDSDPDLSIVSKTPAAVAIHDIVDAHPNAVSLICVGPLTNLALSLKLYDDLAAKIKDVWIMGGNYTGVGNVSRAAEFNFHVDPEAAYIALENLKCPIYVLPWETCLLPKIPLEWRFEALGNATPELTLLTKAEEIIYKKHNREHWIPCDTFLTFAFTNPDEHIVKSSIHHASVELHGDLTRGQVVLDHLKMNQPNVVIIENIDSQLFVKEMLKCTKSLIC